MRSVESNLWLWCVVHATDKAWPKITLICTAQPGVVASVFQWVLPREAGIWWISEAWQNLSMEVTFEEVSFICSLAVLAFQFNLEFFGSVVLNFQFSMYFAVWQNLQCFSVFQENAVGMGGNEWMFSCNKCFFWSLSYKWYLSLKH